MRFGRTPAAFDNEDLVLVKIPQYLRELGWNAEEFGAEYLLRGGIVFQLLFFGGHAINGGSGAA